MLPVEISLLLDHPNDGGLTESHGIFFRSRVGAQNAYHRRLSVRLSVEDFFLLMPLGMLSFALTCLAAVSSAFVSFPKVDLMPTNSDDLWSPGARVSLLTLVRTIASARPIVELVDGRPPAFALASVFSFGNRYLDTNFIALHSAE